MAAKPSKHDQNEILECASISYMHSSEDPEHDKAIRKRMLAHIAAGKAYIRSQQRGEEDLSPKEKFSILAELLDHKPAVFLERFHLLLQKEDLEVFRHLTGDYEIDFYLKEARKRLRAVKSHTRVKNRRYEALKKLEREGTYFEDQAMKDRDPLMFEEYVGQYMTEEERTTLLKPIDPSDLKFSNILMTFMDEQETKELHKRQKEAEDDMMEEEDEADDDDEDGDAAVASSSSKQETPKKVVEREPTPASEEEKALMRQEFLHHMHLRFLSGQEKDFDYSAVDGNAEYDSLVLRTQDEEEHYFDDEEEETWSLEEGERRTGDEDDKDEDYCNYDVTKIGKSENRTDIAEFSIADENKYCAKPNGTNVSDPVENEDMEIDRLLE